MISKRRGYKLKIIRKIVKYIKQPERIVILLGQKKIGKFISDKVFLKCSYKIRLGKKLNLKKPQTYNEKLQWLKLYDRNPLYSTMVDKYDVKKYVSDIIGEEYIIPTLAVWDRVEDIDFNSLPEQFVLKCTHDSGGLVICKDKSKLNIKKAIEKLKKSMRRNYFYNSREWPYKPLKPRIIAEQYMEDESGYELKDYKFFCFDGEVKALFIATDRGVEGEETKFDFFDENFNHLPIKNGHDNATREFVCPNGFEKMKELASRLSKGIPQLRVDFYNINGKIYFGELTFFHWGGLKPFEPEEWDYTFGSYIKLPEKRK